MLDLRKWTKKPIKKRIKDRQVRKSCCDAERIKCFLFFLMAGHLHLKWLPSGKLKLAPSVPFLESGQALQIKKDRRKHGWRDKGRCLRFVRLRVKCRNENPNWYVGRPNPCPRGHRRRHGVKKILQTKMTLFFFPHSEEPCYRELPLNVNSEDTRGTFKELSSGLSALVLPSVRDKSRLWSSSRCSKRGC